MSTPRPLTFPQKVFALHEVGRGDAVALTALQAKALMWLDLDEASGTRFDKTPNNRDFAVTGTVPVIAGLQGMNACDFPGSGLNHLSLPAVPSVLVTDASWSGSAWLWSDVAGPKVAMCHRSSTSGTAQKWSLIFNVGTMSFNQLDTSIPTNRSAGAAFSTGVWHHVYFQYDEPGNLVGISIDNAALVTGAWSGTPQLADHPIVLGDGVTTGFLPWDGRAQFFGLFNQLLSVAERNTLFNGGLGASWAML